MKLPSLPQRPTPAETHARGSSCHPHGLPAPRRCQRAPQLLQKCIRITAAPRTLTSTHRMGGTGGGGVVKPLLPGQGRTGAGRGEVRGSLAIPGRQAGGRVPGGGGYRGCSLPPPALGIQDARPAGMPGALPRSPTQRSPRGPRAHPKTARTKKRGGRIFFWGGGGGNFNGRGNVRAGGGGGR